ncbi:MAG: hypothetical protein ABN482_01585 [Corticimicrobacter sp.]|uniref:hypothetical protein n=1 Tax=Corticimicrobacter sp. TaxID=2678536 RepID=UPI0032DA844A
MPLEIFIFDVAVRESSNKWGVRVFDNSFPQKLVFDSGYEYLKVIWAKSDNQIINASSVDIPIDYGAGRALAVVQGTLPYIDNQTAIKVLSEWDVAGMQQLMGAKVAGNILTLGWFVFHSGMGFWGNTKPPSWHRESHRKQYLLVDVTGY